MMVEAFDSEALADEVIHNFIRFWVFLLSGVLVIATILLLKYKGVF